MLVNIGLSDLYTGEILESDGKRYYVLLLMPKVRGKVHHMNENGEYRGTVRLFDVDTGEYTKNINTITSELTVSEKQMTEEEKEAFLLKLKLLQSISTDVYTYVNAKFEDVKNIFHIKEGEKILISNCIYTTYNKIVTMESGILKAKKIVKYKDKWYGLEEKNISCENLFVGTKIEEEIYPTTPKIRLKIEDKVKMLKEKFLEIKEEYEKEKYLTELKLGIYSLKSFDKKAIKEVLREVYYNTLKSQRVDYINEDNECVFTRYHVIDESVESALNELYLYLVELFDLGEKIQVKESLERDYPMVKLGICRSNAERRKYIRAVLPRLKKKCKLK